MTFFSAARYCNSHKRNAPPSIPLPCSCWLLHLLPNLDLRRVAEATTQEASLIRMYQVGNIYFIAAVAVIGKRIRLLASSLLPSTLLLLTLRPANSFCHFFFAQAARCLVSISPLCLPPSLLSLISAPSTKMALTRTTSAVVPVLTSRAVSPLPCPAVPGSAPSSPVLFPIISAARLRSRSAPSFGES